MENWASKELEHVDLGDARRNKRLVRIVEDLAAQPTKECASSLWKFSSNNFTHMIFGVLCTF